MNALSLLLLALAACQALVVSPGRGLAMRATRSASPVMMADDNPFAAFIDGIKKQFAGEEKPAAAPPAEEAPEPDAPADEE